MIHCTSCNGRLDEEEEEAPRKDDDGDIVCDQCWSEENEDTCEMCCNLVDNEELDGKPGEVIAVWHDAPGDHGEVKAGYYRVLDWPFFGGSLLGSSRFFNNMLERVSDLDEEGLETAKNTNYPSSALCLTCRKKVEESLKGVDSGKPLPVPA